VTHPRHVGHPLGGKSSSRPLEKRADFSAMARAGDRHRDRRRHPPEVAPERRAPAPTPSSPAPPLFKDRRASYRANIAAIRQAAALARARRRGWGADRGRGRPELPRSRQGGDFCAPTAASDRVTATGSSDSSRRRALIISMSRTVPVVARGANSIGALKNRHAITSYRSPASSSRAGRSRQSRLFHCTPDRVNGFRYLHRPTRQRPALHRKVTVPTLWDRKTGASSTTNRRDHPHAQQRVRRDRRRADGLLSGALRGEIDRITNASTAPSTRRRLPLRLRALAAAYDAA